MLLNHWSLFMGKNLSQNQVERLLDLVPYLTANSGVSLEKIADDFATTKANVIDDLNTLWMCGLPGYTPLELIDLSFDTGYVSIRNADVLSKPRKLSSAELSAVIVGLSILRESISVSNAHYESLCELITRLTSTSNIPVPALLSSDVAPEIRLLAEEAIKTHRNMLISYHSFNKDSESVRKIYPLSFQIIEGREYLESFCHQSQDFRLFRLDRMKEASLGDEHESVSTPFSKDVVLREFSIRILENARKVSETFHIDVSADFRPSDIFRCNAFNDDWIIRTICSLEALAIVFEPSDLRKLISARAERALSLYR